jgi:chromosome segregation ATPase
VGLGYYAVYVGVAFVGTLVAVAILATLRWYLSIYFNRTKLDGEALRAEMTRSLAIIRAELHTAVAKAEAAAGTARSIGDGVIAAAKPIEGALRHLSSRIAAMEFRADTSDRLHADHKSSAERLQSSWENNAHVAGEMDVRLNEIQRQLAATTDQLSSLDEAMREVTLNSTQSNSIVTGIDGRLREIEQRFAKFSDRVDRVFHEMRELEARLKSGRPDVPKKARPTRPAGARAIRLPNPLVVREK